MPGLATKDYSREGSAFLGRLTEGEKNFQEHDTVSREDLSRVTQCRVTLVQCTRSSNKVPWGCVNSYSWDRHWVTLPGQRACGWGLWPGSTGQRHS